MKRVVLRVSAMEKIERAIARRTLAVAQKTYEFIVTGEYPYWSGAYINSWDINQEKEGGNFPQGDEETYDPPGSNQFDMLQPNYALPYKSWYVANDYWHYDKESGHPLRPGMAHQVEFGGTPNHEKPWKVMTEAYNNVKYGVPF